MSQLFEIHPQTPQLRLVRRAAEIIRAGGVVVYPFRPETGSMTSTFRRDAIRLIEEQCGRRYTIVREGEAKGRSRVHHVQGAEEVIQERRWGIQFECK